jgi:hypothetical protein
LFLPLALRTLLLRFGGLKMKQTINRLLEKKEIKVHANGFEKQSRDL